MTLTKKQIKHYKPLIQKKLTEMGIKNEIGYTQTGTTKVIPQLVKTDDGFKVENRRVPNYRAANLYKSLTKKLCNLGVLEVERFLATEMPRQEEPRDEVLIEETETTEK